MWVSSKGILGISVAKALHTIKTLKVWFSRASKANKMWFLNRGQYIYSCCPFLYGDNLAFVLMYYVSLNCVQTLFWYLFGIYIKTLSLSQSFLRGRQTHKLFISVPACDATVETPVADTLFLERRTVDGFSVSWKGAGDLHLHNWRSSPSNLLKSGVFSERVCRWFPDGSKWTLLWQTCFS